jgi:galactokinase/mevalonate kinase-like predicted kinase
MEVKDELPISDDDLINSVFAIENYCMKQSVGVQDIAFAVIGGCGSLKFTYDDRIYTKYRFFPGHAENFFNTHGLLFFTNLSRNSSDVVGKYIGSLVNSPYQKRIHEIATYMQEVFLKESCDLHKIGYMLKESWFCKQQISPHIMTSALQELDDKIRKFPQKGFKLLGGGGGGSYFILSEPAHHEEIIAELTAAGCIHIPYKISGGAERIL